MKRTITFILLMLICFCGYAQTIDPVLLEEMGQHRDNEKIRVFVIMRQQYDQQQLNSRAAYYTTRAERREFVVNELKQFAETSQYDLRHSLTEMQRNDMVSEPKVLWIANAIFFEATRDAILSLADRSDIMVIGYDEERSWLPDGEESTPAEPTRGITPNVTQVNADQVWNLGYTGQGVVVAVIDTGVNYNHLDLADHLWDGGTEFPYHGYDVYNNDNNPMDDHGHGTHCAGTVCGDGTAGSQTGMAPDATLMCVKVLSAGGNGSDADVCEGMQWAVEHGCDVISMSLGGHGHSGAEQTIIRNACVNVLNAGVIASIAAGNEGNQLTDYPIPDNVGLPGGCPPPYLDPDQQQNPGGLSCSVCVGAVDSNDGAAYFTSHGPRDWSDSDYADYPYTAGSQTAFGLIRPDVCAPGVEIISADYANTSGYTTMSGTSMATPCVAGCMALMLSKDNNATPEDLCRILEETAVPLSYGKSNIYGYGRVDVLAAINALCPLTIESIVVNDEQGNNDGNLNSGEAVTLDLTLLNGSDNALDGGTLVLSTDSEYVTITNGTATLPHFDAGQTQTIENIFGFVLMEGAPGNSAIQFAVETFIDGEFIGYIRFEVMVDGHALRFDEVTILNDNNGNGILEAGETADLHVVISNIGNEPATSIVGTLSTAFPYLSINGTTGTFGTIEVDGQASADFNVTLSSGVPDVFIINFSLDLVDDNEKHTQVDFELTKGMIVFADPAVKAICLSNWDTNGDGGLSYAEAAAVTSLGEVFRNKYAILSFNELQYFTGLTSIGSYAFYNCTNLTSIELPNSLISIYDHAFDYCEDLTSIEIPNSVTYIGWYAFSHCSGLTSIEIPNSVTSIGNGSFFGCSGLTSIELPNSIHSIPSYVFYGCSGLTSMELPSSLASIGYEAFYNCTGLTSMVVWADSPPTFTGYPIFDNVSRIIPIYVPCDSEEAYKNARLWSDFINIIGMCSGEVTVTINPSEGGTVTGEGYYEGGDLCTLTATPNPGFSFANWTENGVVVSRDSVFSFPANLSTIVANFRSNSSIIFADANVKTICVSLWDTNGDGELSYAEAAAVTNLGNAFRGNSSITSFDELQYFIGLTSIGAGTFIRCSGLTSIIIPNSVTSIDGGMLNGAFMYCYGLTSIEIPNSVTFIGQSAFESCTGLTSIELPNSLTSIDHQAFSGCPLTSIEIPNSVIYIGLNPFLRCGLRQIIVESGNTAYDSRDNCNAIINSSTNELITGCKNTVIPNSVISIGVWAFSGCYDLTSIEIPNSVTTIYSGAFEYCSSLTSIEIPNSVTNMGTNPFSDCSGLEQIIVEAGNTAYDSRDNCNAIINSSTNELITGCKNTVIPNSVTSIGDYAFDFCTGLASIEIPNSVTSIGYKAFSVCYNLASIAIPNSVTSIGSYAFSGCHGLTSMAVFAETPPTLGNSVFNNVNKSIPVYVLCDTAEDYQNADGWNEFTNIIGFWCSGEIAVTINPSEGGTVTGAGYYEGGDLCVLTATPNPGFSFSNWTENGVVVSTDTIYAFHAHPTTIVANFCTHSSIVFADDNVKAICVANWDTNGDSELSYIEAAAVTSLGGVFRGKTSISSFNELQYFTGLTSIDNSAFYYCSGLTSIEIPNSVTSIGSDAFSGCNSLTSIEFPQSVTSIGYHAFSGCTSLTSIEIPKFVTSISANPFERCSGLEQIIVEAGNPIYDSRDNCNAIINSSTNELITGCKNTIIPNSVTSIGIFAFNGCNGLVSIEIPNAVISIGAWAFENCLGLTSIEIPNSVISISGNPFTGCSGLEQIIVDADNTVYDSRDNCNAIINSSTNVLITGCKNTIIPISVTSIGSYAFSGCIGLISIGIPNAVTSIGSSAFEYCTSLTSIEIPNSVTSIESYAFSYCSGLIAIEIPNSVTSIGSAVFRNCDGLISIEIPNSVTSIGSWAFYHCLGLTSLEIPNSVTSIDSRAFYYCTGLTSMTVLADNPPTLGDYAFGNVNKSIPVYVPCGSLESYQQATGWNEFTNIQEICTQTQTLTLSEGWNWCSFNVDITLDDLKTALVEALPGTTITISSQTQSTSYIGSMWRGQLSTLDVTMMYKIMVTQGCELTLEGVPVNAAEHPVTINNGYNWMAFPLSQSMSLSNAFAGFAVSGDVVSSQTQNATYNGSMWRGTLGSGVLEPGKGYKYHSNASETRTFTFPASAK